MTQIDTGDAVRVSDQQTNTFENLKDGKFTFDTKSFTDNQLGQGGHRAEDQARLPRSISKQLASKNLQLEAAVSHRTHDGCHQERHAGNRLFEARVFDGSDDGDKALPATMTVVGKPVTLVNDEADPSNAGAFSKATSGRSRSLISTRTPKPTLSPVYRTSSEPTRTASPAI